MFVQFIDFEFVVHGPLGHSLFPGVVEMTDWTAGIGKDNAIGGDATLEHLLQFIFGGAIKADSQLGQSLNNCGIVVALDRVVGSDAGQQLLPQAIFTLHTGQITNVECLVAVLQLCLGYDFLNVEHVLVIIDSLSAHLYSVSDELRLTTEC